MNFESRKSQRWLELLTLALLLISPQAFAQSTDSDFNCDDFSSQPEAQATFEAQGGPEQDPNRLDTDGDGIACETEDESAAEQGTERRPTENQSFDDQTIIGVASQTPDFSVLLTAIDLAGLTETLQGTGPFTIFAPTNKAFAKLSSEERDALFANQEALRQVLSYHVVPGSFTTSDITAEMTAFPTLEGADLPITQQGVGDATVTAVNIPAANGVVFTIDTVLTPPAAVADTEPNGNDGADPLYSSTAEASERYPLTDLGGSGVSGSVLVAEYAGGRAVLSISLSGTPAGGLHPAALYTGSCEQFSGDAVSALEPVIGDTGFSTTVANVPFADIVSGDHALFINASEADPTAVACGEVGQ